MIKETKLADFFFSKSAKSFPSNGFYHIRSTIKFSSKRIFFKQNDNEQMPKQIISMHSFIWPFSAKPNTAATEGKETVIKETNHDAVVSHQLNILRSDWIILELE